MLLLMVALAQAPQDIELQPGMLITQSARVARKTYALSGGGPLITIRGDNITVDFNDATLEGTPSNIAPDRRTGVAILVEAGSNVRITNARVHGYRFGIIARGTHNLTLEDNDFSDTWKPRLFSLVEHESLVDWLSFHNNESNQWLRFGAAIYLEDVNGGALRENVALGGMNGLMLVRSNGLMIRDNNFSFNSGLGVGLYRSSDDTIVHNQIDYNVRGYSHGFYTRGQDSGNLLLYEQSNRNVVAFNSLTHGGDGIFLWAGQTTMDSGQGGSNDNLFYGNDVSFATANGVEATFSRNRIIANKSWGSEYGIWAGYSFETAIIGNDFKNNRTGIAIEHGQSNTIAFNKFDGDSTAIRLWADTIPPSDWGYPKFRDTRSRDYKIGGNQFTRNQITLKVANTTGLDTAGSIRRPAAPEFSPKVSSPPASDLSRRARGAIIVDQWGPYDYRTPKLWPLEDSSRAVPLRLATFGPSPGASWTLVSMRGIAIISRDSGRIGETIAVTPHRDSTGDWGLTLRSGSRDFSYEWFEPKIDWLVRFSSDTSAIPRPPLRRLDFMWYRPPRAFAFLPQANWSLEAAGVVTLPEGEGAYSIRAISDDAVRVWVDGSLVIDAWTPHESRVDYAPITPGEHGLRVEYKQVDGWVELRVDIIRGSSRSAGSPGPH
jgi:parallel beta-helix repeat protein